jgi:hypothetical protein
LLADQLASATLEIPADLGAFYELALEMGWGDGLPMIPPTDDRVMAMLATTPYRPDDVICVLPPRSGVATAEAAAINAVMAGAEPAAFPWVVAALEAIAAPEFNAVALTTTTSSVFPMLIVNGPSRDQLRIDYRAGCLGGAAGRGSMTIGRAVSLCLRNIGGQKAGQTSRTVFGQPARLGLCFGEWEERSPWPSLAVRRGFRSQDDVVSVHGGKGTFTMADINNDDPRDLAYLIAKCIAYPLSNHYLERTGENGEIVLLVNPMWAQRFAQAFPAVESFQEFLLDNAWQPIELWPEKNQTLLRAKDRVAGRGRVHVVRRSDQIVPVVCGGLGSLHAVALPSFGQSAMTSVVVARR